MITPKDLISSATDDIDAAGNIPPGSDDRQCLYLAALAKLALANTLQTESQDSDTREGAQ
jgi:hypothetical protein